MPATVPKGQPAELVPDPSGDSVWWWAIDPAGVARVYRFDTRNGQLSTWSLGNAQSTGLVTGEQSGLAVGVDRTIWVGANLKLARLDTTTGAVQIIDLPPVAPSPQADEHRPPEMAGFHDIAGVAADASGDVAVVTTASPQIVIYHSDTANFTYLDLPPGTTAIDAAYTSNGSLGVAEGPPAGPQDDEVLLVGPNGTMTTTSPLEAAFIVAYRNRFLVGEDHLFWVYSDATVTPLTDSDPTEQWMAYPSTHPVWPLSNGQVVSLAIGDEGFIDLARDGSASSIVLAERPCPEGPQPVGGGPPPESSPTNATAASTTTLPCHTDVAAFTTLGDSIWYLEYYNGQAYVWRVDGQ